MYFCMCQNIRKWYIKKSKVDFLIPQSKTSHNKYYTASFSYADKALDKKIFSNNDKYLIAWGFDKVNKGFKKKLALLKILINMYTMLIIVFFKYCFSIICFLGI